MSNTSPHAPGQLQDQVVLVIGAGGGIGQGVAVELAREGAIVVLSDDPHIDHTVTARLIEQLGGQSWICAFPYPDEGDQTQVIEAVFARYGRINLVVHGPCSVAVTDHGVAGIDRETGEAIFRQNLIEPFFLTRRIIQEMRERKVTGSIIFLAPMPVHLGGGLSLDPVSASTSAALEALTRSLALDVAAADIRVNAIAFGKVTNKNQSTPYPDPLVPLGYRITAADIGAGVVFLASSSARFITGVTLTIDGGLSLISMPYLLTQGQFQM